ncbi:MAG: GTP cyclohydrolase FolE2 [Kiritimatiellae bacterium]|nr:GTP cyclohydrolase FolE2 [Kiritimatiellia bacterium]MDD5521137.1 GTP cyclohydrolase FolE2 [Kiritimatiellia bacterium]
MTLHKLKDIQNSIDVRRTPVQKVGIRNLRYPILVLDRRNASQDTVATINMFVDLPHRFKGTHMSRFVEIINHCRGRVSVHQIGNILKTMIKKFESVTAHIDIRFPYFIEKSAPVSGAKSLMDYDCAFLAAMDAKKKRNPLDLILEVAVPVTTLCPCSKEISKYGAHNQRSKITIQVRTLKLVWLEDLIEIAESAASAPLYSLLKREDEKSVTETAYKNPRFAEDIVRSVAVRLRADPRISWYQVETENFESIHNHNAYALVTGTRK